MSGKLHEVLAVETGLKTASDNIIKEAVNTFTDKRGHFLGQVRNYNVLLADTIQYPNEVKEIESTVKEKLEYVFEHLGRAIDSTYQKEVTNTKAKADILIDGITLAKDVPATFLLHLESRFTQIRQMFEAIPTLEPGRKWTNDTQRNDVYISDAPDSFKTEKVLSAFVLAPATDKHPAQVEKISSDKIIGKYITTNYSGCLSVAQKSALLAKIDLLLREVKKARQRANNTEVENVSISKLLIDYLTK